MIEADPHDQRGPLQAGKLAGLHLDRVRVLLGDGKARHLDAVAAHRLHQGLQIGRGRDDQDPLADPFLCDRRRRRDDRGQRHDQELAQDLGKLVKIDFGIMQCTPLRTSTTCDTRQSPTMETRP